MTNARAPKRELPIIDPRKLNGALADLQARERRILELRYGVGEARRHSLAQIGRRFGISGERVRQIEAQALRRLAENGGMPASKPVAVSKRASSCETLPRTALEAWTLVLLRREPAHGYDLLRRLDWPGDGLGPRLYRLLRDLEQSGLVRSDWTDSAAGPERRVYRLTRKGARQLTHDAQGLHRLFETLERFFEHYAQASGDSDSGRRRGARPAGKTGRMLAARDDA